GKFGKDLTFDGTDDVLVTNSSAPISPTSNFTFSSWVRMDEDFSSYSTENQTIVDKGDYKLFLDETNGKAAWVINTNTPNGYYSLGSGLNNNVSVIQGWGNDLYIGGIFTDAGGDPNADNITKWDGYSFSWPSGQGLIGGVSNLIVWNNELYASGG